MNRILIGVMMFCSICTYSQSSIYDRNYTLLTSKGQIPNDLLSSEIQNLDISVPKDSSVDEKSINKLKLNLYYTKNEKLIYFNRGLLLFGDKVTVYLNKIKNEILKDDDELSEKIKIYTLLSSIPNAYCTSDGTVFVTIGLLAKLEHENQLAFIIGHEISHYQLNHINDEILKKDEHKDHNKDQSIEEKTKAAFKRSQQDEFEADSLGYLLYNKTYNDHEGALSAISALARAELPIGDTIITTQTLSTPNLSFPSCFLLNETNKRDKVDEQTDETFSTHPNFFDRKMKLVKDNKIDSTYHLKKCSEQFADIKLTCQFELIEILLRSRKYADAIYTAFVLTKKYPNNTYLKESIGKCLYSISKYKNHALAKMVIGGYLNKKGPSQQLFYIFKNTTSKQLSSFTINYLSHLAYDSKNKDHFIAYRSDLIRELVLKKKMRFKDFFNEQTAKEYLSKIKGFDFINSSESKVAQRRTFKEFYKLALYGLKDINEIELEFKKHEKVLIEEERVEKLPFKEQKKYYKEKLESKEQKSIEKISDVLFTGFTFYLSSVNAKKVEDIVNFHQVFHEVFNKRVQTKFEHALYYDDYRLTTNGVNKYNEICRINKWLLERVNHVGKVKMLPLIFYEPQIQGYRYIAIGEVTKKVYNKRTISNYRNEKLKEKQSTQVQVFVYDKITGNRVKVAHFFEEYDIGPKETAIKILDKLNDHIK